MMNNLLDWEERDFRDFAHEHLVQMVFSKVQRYKIDGRFQGLDIILKIASHDPSPSFKELYELWGEDAVITVNVPVEFANELAMLLKLVRYDFIFDTDVIQGYQDALGVRFRKLILVPSDEISGEMVCYIHSMNDLGDGRYIRVPIYDALSFALKHKNVPIYASEKLFLNDHLRARRREIARLESKFGFSSTMTWNEKVKTAIKNIKPKEFELYTTKTVLLSELSEEELQELKDYAVSIEKYEWAQFLTGIQNILI